MSIKVDKPWGFEVVTTTPDLPYTGKILSINANSKLSLQYHDQKTETLALFSGQAILTLNNQDINMQPLVGYTVKPQEIHRITAIKPSIIIEVSTPETGTTFRVNDDYSRGDETSEVRNLPNRGWKNN